MRLYEFTDPTKYLLPESDAIDLLKIIGNLKTSDTADDAVRRLRKRPEAQKPSNTL
jgi:hypothetical protein